MFSFYKLGISTRLRFLLKIWDVRGNFLAYTPLKLPRPPLATFFYFPSAPPPLWMISASPWWVPPSPLPSTSLSSAGLGGEPPLIGSANRNSRMGEGGTCKCSEQCSWPRRGEHKTAGGAPSVGLPMAPGRLCGLQLEDRSMSERIPHGQ
jgi:hypothetical protein